MQQALADLRSSLNRVRNLANDASANTQAAMNDAALLERHETALSAVVVTLAGFVESFLRQTAEEYASQIEAQNHPFTDLKPVVRYAHYTGGGKLLAAIGGEKRSSRHNWTTTDAIDLSSRLASVSAGQGYQLVWEAFAETKGNPGPDVIREFLERFGVKAPIQAIENHVGRSISLPLQSFIDIRNECAHSGQANQTPQPSDVLSYCDLIDQVADGIVATLSTHNIRRANVTPSNTVPALMFSRPAPNVGGLTSAASGSAKKSLLQRLIGLLENWLRLN